MLSPLTITLSYLLLSVAWIVFSDQLVSLIPDRAIAERLQSVKGILFVTATSGWIFVLIARYRRLLLAEAEARAAERQRRESLDRFLARLRPGRTPEATALHICTAIAQLPGIGLVAYLTVDRGGLVTLAIHSSLPGWWQTGRSLPEALAHEVRERAERAAWLEDAALGADPGSLAAALRSAGLRDAVLTPVRHDGTLVGVLLAAAGPPASAASHLEAVIEVARIASAWLGPVAIARRDRERRKAELRRAAVGARINFQPIVDLARGRAVGHEALSRFADGASPAERFAEAAALEIGLELEEAAIRRAVQEAVQLPRGGWLALNVSAALLLDPRLAALLAGADRPIVLELTEQQAITDYARIRTALVELGPDIRLALDDIGEAFSGLRHLVELGPAFAKLDLALVRDIDADPARQALVAGLRHYALQTGTVLIAEGIETLAERRALRSLGVRLGQGFLLGRPMAAGQLAACRRPGNDVRRLAQRSSPRGLRMVLSGNAVRAAKRA